MPRSIAMELSGSGGSIWSLARLAGDRPSSEPIIRAASIRLSPHPPGRMHRRPLDALHQLSTQPQLDMRLARRADSHAISLDQRLIGSGQQANRSGCQHVFRTRPARRVTDAPWSPRFAAALRVHAPSCALSFAFEILRRLPSNAFKAAGLDEIDCHHAPRCSPLSTGILF